MTEMTETTTRPGKRTYAKLGLALLFIVPILAFITLALEVQEPGPIASSHDASILRFIHGFSSTALDPWVVHLTNLGGVEAIIVLTIVAAIILFFLRKRRAMAILLIGVGGAAIINTVLKLSFHRVRPSLWAPVITETSFSFPSGHAMMSSALAFSAILILWETKWRWYAVVLGLLYTLTIGLTRLYLGVHYPTDVLAGWIVSFIWLLTVKAILTRRQLRAAGREVE